MLTLAWGNIYGRQEMPVSTGTANDGLMRVDPLSGVTSANAGKLTPPCPSRPKKNLIGTRTQTGFPVSHRKQTTGAHSNRYTKGGSLFRFAPPESPTRHRRNLRFPFAVHPKINRHTKLIESRVSHSKQRTRPQINRHISAMSRPSHVFANSAKPDLRHSTPRRIIFHLYPCQ
jgi:hypothetical protein